MRLRVNGTTDLRFGQVFLLPEIRKKLVESYSPREAQIVDEYLRSMDYPIKSSKKALAELVRHLYVQKQPKCLVICLDNNMKLNKEIQCEDFAGLLNYGNLEVPPLKLFDRVMNQVAEMLSWWYSLYLGEC